jgi:hypothetical protein
VIETEILTVGGLTAEHVGWRIRVADPDPVIDHRTFVLAEVRHWTYQGEGFVGLVEPAESAGPISGTERIYTSSAPCQVLEQVKRTRPKKRAGAARKAGEQR